MTMNYFHRALESKYRAEIDRAVATIDLYFNHSVGVGDHGDILGVLDDAITALETNGGKLETLKKLFENAVPEEAQSEETEEK